MSKNRVRSQKVLVGSSRMNIKETDRYLPIANVGRVMKSALPPHAKLSRESKECIQECVSEFISFVTSEAAYKCSLEKRKTLNGEDILWSMNSLGFDSYAEALKIYLVKFRQYEFEANLKSEPQDDDFLIYLSENE